MLPGHDPNWKELNCTGALLLKGKIIAKKKGLTTQATFTNILKFY